MRTKGSWLKGEMREDNVSSDWCRFNTRPALGGTGALAGPVGAVAVLLLLEILLAAVIFSAWRSAGDRWREMSEVAKWFTVFIKKTNKSMAHST